MDDPLLVATFAAAGATAIRLAYRHWAVGLLLVLLLFSSHAFLDTLPPLLITPVSIYPDDIVFVVLFAAALPRVLKGRILSVGWLCWAVFGLVMAASVTFGVSLHGMTNAGNDARTFFYFYVGVTYFGSCGFAPGRFLWVAKGWVICAAFLIPVALVRWIALLAGSSFQGLGEGQESWLELRVLNAAQSLYILQAMILLFFISGRRRRAGGAFVRPATSFWQVNARRLWLVAFGIPASVVVIILQHRSVWAVGVVSICMILMYEARRRLHLLSGILFVVSLTAAAWEFLDLGRSALGESLRESSVEVLHQDSTFVWRVNQWNMYYQEGYLSDTREWLLGKPFGAPYGSMYGATDVSPHNWYVNLVLRTGLLGLFSLLAVLGYLILKLWRLSRTSATYTDEARALIVLLSTQTIFSTVYSPGIEQCIYIGTAYALASASAKETAVLRTPSVFPGRLPSETDESPHRSDYDVTST